MRRAMCTLSPRGPTSANDANTQSPIASISTKRPSLPFTFKNRDFAWILYQEQMEPVIIIKCMPRKSAYKVVWLRWVDATDHVRGRKGQCCISIETAKHLVRKVSEEEIQALGGMLFTDAKWEIQRWRPDMYEKYFVDDRQTPEDYRRWETRIIDFVA